MADQHPHDPPTRKTVWTVIPLDRCPDPETLTDQDRAEVARFVEFLRRTLGKSEAEKARIYLELYPDGPHGE